MTVTPFSRNLIDQLAPPPVQAVPTTNINIASTLSTADSYSVSVGDLIGLINQTNYVENGVYVVTAGNNISRAQFDLIGSNILTGFKFIVQNGSTYAGQIFTLITPGPITIGTTALQFTQLSSYVKTSRFGSSSLNTSTQNSTAFAKAALAVQADGIIEVDHPGQTLYFDNWIIPTACKLSLYGVHLISTTANTFAAVIPISGSPQSCIYFCTALGAEIPGNITVEGGHIEFSSSIGTVLGATNTTPIVINEAAHGRSTSDTVSIYGVIGNSAANGLWTITKTDNDHYSLNTSIGNGAYVTGGNVQLGAGVSIITTLTAGTILLRDVELNGAINRGVVIMIAASGVSTALPKGSATLLVEGRTYIHDMGEAGIVGSGQFCKISDGVKFLNIQSINSVDSGFGVWWSGGICQVNSVIFDNVGGCNVNCVDRVKELRVNGTIFKPGANVGLGIFNAINVLNEAEEIDINCIIDGSNIPVFSVTDGYISASSKILTSASNPFLIGHTGMIIDVVGAGSVTDGIIQPLRSTIATFNSSGSVTLADAATTTVTNTYAKWGAQIQNGINVYATDQWSYPIKNCKIVSNTHDVPFIALANILISPCDTDLIDLDITVTNCDPVALGVAVLKFGSYQLSDGPRFIPRKVLVRQFTSINAGILYINCGDEIVFNEVSIIRSVPYPENVGIEIGGSGVFKQHVGRIKFSKIPDIVGMDEQIFVNNNSFLLGYIPFGGTYDVGQLPNLSPTTGGHTALMCSTPGTVETISTTTGNTTLGSPVITNIPTILNFRRGDYITVANAGITLAQVLSVHGVITLGQTNSGSNIIVNISPTSGSVSGLLTRFSIGDYVAVAGVTWGASSLQFAQIGSINVSSRQLLVNLTANQTTGSVEVSINKVIVSQAATATLGGAAISWPVATIRPLDAPSTTVRSGSLSAGVWQDIKHTREARTKPDRVNFTFNDISTLGGVSGLLIVDVPTGNFFVAGCSVLVNTPPSGPSISGMLLDVGTATNPTAILNGVDIFNASAGTRLSTPVGSCPLGEYTGQTIQARFRSSGANLSACSAGDVDVVLLISHESSGELDPQEYAQLGFWISADDAIVDLNGAININSVSIYHNKNSNIDFWFNTTDVANDGPQLVYETPSANYRPEFLFSSTLNPLWLTTSNSSRTSRVVVLTDTILSRSAFTIFWVGWIGAASHNNANIILNDSVFGTLDGYFGLYAKSDSKLYANINLSGVAKTTTGLPYTPGQRAVYCMLRAWNFGSANAGVEATVSASGNRSPAFNCYVVGRAVGFFMSTGCGMSEHFSFNRSLSANEILDVVTRAKNKYGYS